MDIADLAQTITESCIYVGDCLIWTGGTNDAGYGRVNVRALHPEGKSKLVLTHRIIAANKYGFDVLDTNIVVRHSCDTPACNNEDHLLLGTQLDNVQDMIERGRNSLPPPGPRLFTLNEVRSICNDTRSQRAIAKAWGVSKGTIQKIREGRTYR